MTKSVHSMIDEYFNIYVDKIKEYGENTAILFQVGSTLPPLRSQLQLYAVTTPTTTTCYRGA